MGGNVRFVTPIVLWILLLFGTTAAEAAGGTWNDIRSTSVSASDTRKVIDFETGDPKTLLPRAMAVRLVARSGSVVVKRVIISYGNGQIHFEERRIQLNEGERSKPIAEREEGPVVVGIELEFESPPAGNRPAEIVFQMLQGDTATDRPGKGKAAPIASGEKEYEEVQIGFATTRQRLEGDRVKRDAEGRTVRLAQFDGNLAKAGNRPNGDFAPGLTLGRAIVTIPIDHEVGAPIRRPEIDIGVWRFQYRKENPSKDFTLAAVDVQTQAEFVASLRTRLRSPNNAPPHALVFVHGYNVSFNDALFRAAQLAHDLEFDGPVIAYSWPSGGNAAAYKHDLDMAKSSRRGLAELLETIAAIPEIQSVNIIAHSMGNDPVLEVLSERSTILRSGGKLPDLKLNEILLAAPDIPWPVFEQQAAGIRKLVAGGVTLYASENDKALKASKQLSLGTTRAGEVPPNGPIVVNGIDSIDISAASTSMFALNHTTFAERAMLVGDIKAVLGFSQHPPDARSGSYATKGLEGRRYWKLEATSTAK